MKTPRFCFRYSKASEVPAASKQKKHLDRDVALATDSLSGSGNGLGRSSMC